MANEKTLQLSDLLKSSQEVTTLGNSDRILAVDANGRLLKIKETDKALSFKTQVIQLIRAAGRLENIVIFTVSYHQYSLDTWLGWMKQTTYFPIYQGDACKVGDVAVVFGGYQGKKIFAALLCTSIDEKNNARGNIVVMGVEGYGAWTSPAGFPKDLADKSGG